MLPELNWTVSTLVWVHVVQMFCHIADLTVDFQWRIYIWCVVFSVDDYCYIITKPDLECIDKNTYILVKILNIGKRDFLGLLIKGGCITDTHKDLIMTQTTKCDRNRELLSILRRRSRADLQTFKDTLKRTKQEHVLQTLERKTGRLFSLSQT